MKKSLIALAALAIAGSAFATQPGNNGNGNGGCGVGQQTNGCGGAGGAGGTGGQGGTGVGVGIGISGAAVVGSGNSDVRNTNAQGQQQGQNQSSRNSNRNDNRSNASATGGTSSNINGASSTNSAYIAGATVTVSGDTYVAPEQARIPVATAYAAPLTSSNGTCMGSSSAGGQGAAFGVSFGTTWTDNNCDIRYDAEALRAAGLPGAAQARLCQKKEIADAMVAAGTPCPGSKRAEAPITGTSMATVTPTATRDPQYTDPIVRARLGLPPLK